MRSRRGPRQRHGRDVAGPDGRHRQGRLLRFVATMRMRPNPDPRAQEGVASGARPVARHEARREAPCGLLQRMDGGPPDRTAPTSATSDAEDEATLLVRYETPAWSAGPDPLHRRSPAGGAERRRGGLVADEPTRRGGPSHLRRRRSPAASRPGGWRRSRRREDLRRKVAVKSLRRATGHRPRRQLLPRPASWPRWSTPPSCPCTCCTDALGDPSSS